MHTLFFMKTVVYIFAAHELPWDRIIFSNIKWSQVFSFSLTLSLFWSEFTHINIRFSQYLHFWHCNPNLSIFIKKINISLVNNFFKVFMTQILLQKQPLQIFSKIGVFKNFVKLTEERMYLSLVWSLEGCNVIKKETLTQVFSCRFCKTF